MVSLYLNNQSATVLGLSTDEEGKYSLTHFKQFEFTDPPFSESVLSDPKSVAREVEKLLPADALDLCLVLPEFCYYHTRISLPSNTLEAQVIKASQEMLGIADIESLDFLRQIPYESKTKKLYLYIGIPKNIADPISEFAQSLSVHVKYILPESICTLEIFKTDLASLETVGFVSSESSLIFFDKHGPVVSLATAPEQTVSDQVNQITRKYKIKIKRLLIPALPVRLGDDLKLETVPAYHLLEKKLAEISRSGLDGITMESLNLGLVGSFLLKDPLDFNLANLLEIDREEAHQPIGELLAEDTLTEKTYTKSQGSARKAIFLIAIGFVAGSLTTLLVLILLFSGKSGRLSILSSPTPTPAPTVEPTPTQVAIDRSQVKIQVLNGTTTPKLAKKMADLLDGLGYISIETGNASGLDLIKTKVAVKRENQPLFDLFSKDLKDKLILTQPTSLEASSSFDLVITLGKDFTP